MKAPGTPFAKAAIAALALLSARALLSDDAVGVLGVQSGPAGSGVFAMPFEPFGHASPDSFLLGDFLGDGGECSSDTLLWTSRSGLSSTNAVYSSVLGQWVDSFAGMPTDMSVGPGDALAFLPCGGDGVGFFAFGRVPGFAEGSGLPRVECLSVAPDGASAALEVLSMGRTADILSQDTADGFAADAPWMHRGRFHAGTSASFSWGDAALPQDGARLYLVSDASRDADGDGVPDAMECRVYGTSRHLADTDGDGVDDGLEIAWGTDPLVADGPPIPLSFMETFERPLVLPGTIDGQHGWLATVPGAAAVQTFASHGGEASLAVRSERPAGVDAVASLSVTSSARVVWIDFYNMSAPLDFSAEDGPCDAVAIAGFDASGHPIMSDGESFVTNRSFAAALGQWARQTYRLDYDSGLWDCYLNGLLVGGGLAMRGAREGLRGLDVMGEGLIDDIAFSSRRPPGLSSDGDPLPDEWEFAHFGSLGRDGSGDFDFDGLSDFQEFLAGTDPAVSCSDTDGDGLPDWWELENGLSALSSDWTAGVFFREGFEPPEMASGDDVDGRNGWEVFGGGGRGAGAGQDRIRRRRGAWPGCGFRRSPGGGAGFARRPDAGQGRMAGPAPGGRSGLPWRGALDPRGRQGMPLLRRTLPPRRHRRLRPCHEHGSGGRHRAVGPLHVQD